MHFRSARPLTGQAEGEEIVCSMTERHRGEASQPTTATSAAITPVIGCISLVGLPDIGWLHYFRYIFINVLFSEVQQVYGRLTNLTEIIVC